MINRESVSTKDGVYRWAKSMIRGFADQVPRLSEGGSPNFRNLLGSSVLNCCQQDYRDVGYRGSSRHFHVEAADHYLMQLFRDIP